MQKKQKKISLHIHFKQLQKNQLALTEGLDKNRLAITQGFDKMDEVKKWDLQQLPDYEAIEEPEKTEAIEEYEENPQFLISFNDIALINGDLPDYENNDGEQVTTIRNKLWMLCYHKVISMKLSMKLILLTQTKEYGKWWKKTLVKNQKSG